MLDTFITENEVFTLGTSFRNLIEKAKKVCTDCETAKLVREQAVIEKDSDVIAMIATIKELEKRLDAAVSHTKSIS